MNLHKSTSSSHKYRLSRRNTLIISTVVLVLIAATWTYFALSARVSAYHEVDAEGVNSLNLGGLLGPGVTDLATDDTSYCRQNVWYIQKVCVISQSKLYAIPGGQKGIDELSKRLVVQGWQIEGPSPNGSYFNDNSADLMRVAFGNAKTPAQTNLHLSLLTALSAQDQKKIYLSGFDIKDTELKQKLQSSLDTGNQLLIATSSSFYRTW